MHEFKTINYTRDGRTIDTRYEINESGQVRSGEKMLKQLETATGMPMYVLVSWDDDQNKKPIYVSAGDILLAMNSCEFNPNKHKSVLKDWTKPVSLDNLTYINEYGDVVGLAEECSVPLYDDGVERDWEVIALPWPDGTTPLRRYKISKDALIYNHVQNRFLDSMMLYNKCEKGFRYMVNGSVRVRGVSILRAVAHAFMPEFDVDRQVDRIDRSKPIHVDNLKIGTPLYPRRNKTKLPEYADWEWN